MAVLVLFFVAGLALLAQGARIDRRAIAGTTLREPVDHETTAIVRQVTRRFNAGNAARR